MLEFGLALEAKRNWRSMQDALKSTSSRPPDPPSLPMILRQQSLALIYDTGCDSRANPLARQQEIQQAPPKGLDGKTHV